MTDVQRQAVFGGFDGLTIALGLIAGMAGEPHALIRAAVSAGLAESAGMTGGAWLSGSQKAAAVTNGVAALMACVLPVLPFLVAHGAVAVVSSLVLVVCSGCLIAYARPETGVRSYVQTFGVLLAAALLCLAAGAV
jgi:VIT1/CCC1 family predicted Fe2+/Mn2+ transporter